ncbi:MAG: DUF192 domain-containing protein [Candidatus Caldatribacteriota bacterium]
MLRISVNDKCISEKILVADNMLSRIIGLMFRASPPQEAEGLLLDPCNSIHTCFMRYPLDVAFLNSQNKVIKIIRNLKPWRMTWIYFKASKTLEMPAGKLPMELKEGDILEVEVV